MMDPFNIKNFIVIIQFPFYCFFFSKCSSTNFQSSIKGDTCYKNFRYMPEVCQLFFFWMFNAAASLKVLFQSMNSPSQLNWPANGDDPCGQSWKGITCSGNRVTEMWSHSLSFALYDLIVIVFGADVWSFFLLSFFTYHQ